MAWNDELNKAGVAYKIASAGENRIRVIAGPGTGKSYAIKRRVARLLEKTVPAEKILAVTFTRVAAEDLHRELQKLDAKTSKEQHCIALRCAFSLANTCCKVWAACCDPKSGPHAATA